MSSSAEPPAPRILRLSRTDDPTAYVLIHVSRSGSEPLDLKLVATEGEAPYVGSVRQSRVKSLRAKNYQGSDDEWVQILSYVLRQSPPSDHDATWTTGLEVTASIRGEGDEDKELVILIRKRIDTITQRLGSISLKQDDEQAIELFEWTAITASAADTLETQVASLSARYRAAEDTISKLNAQLEELVRAKSEHEDQLIAKCVQLLNEKKLKIRNQQRLLASSNVDPGKAHELEAAVSDGSRRRKAGASRVSKRKVATPVDADSDEDGFEKMEVDTPKGRRPPAAAPDEEEEEEETDSDRPSTPQPLEDEEETASDDDMEDNEAIPPPAGKEAKVAEVNAVGGIQRNAGPPALQSRHTPPPRRELPFKRTRARDQRQSPPAEKPPPSRPSPEDDEETDDDEL
ncbi:hypothetical protein C8Q69DRAFT_116002 [Paecilomyces variotii]|uniref:Mitotic apparatus protein p62 n=1 Tax=Byssochlamys spectabilis TaxID=264951 RepID=A0A443HIW0_BYSSP|nr:hypothetical protein C8Q69DRAFT_116002 [Paecilomyces variotii]KAJ9288252.1 hypothetical protein DTO021C3_4237 [Paecilomyces variotii]KAJ9356541.1 hypothetical protein DTO280E4_6051 [Paecilomyces variotii]RWQ91782.1 hypothetical protein C8Q69DRAFT_116002 [Paecilomyces variotii]